MRRITHAYPPKRKAPKKGAAAPKTAVIVKAGTSKDIERQKYIQRMREEQAERRR